MALYTDLKDSVDDVVFANGVSSITGTNMQTKLFEMIDSLGEHKFQGVATPATNPGNPDGKVWYFANESGSYTNFSAITVNANELAILRGSGTTWTKYIVFDYSALAAAASGGGEIMGTAIPTTDPGTPTDTEYYFAYQPGSYANFGTSVSAGELCLFKWDTGTETWINYVIYYVAPTTGTTTLGGRTKAQFYYSGATRIPINPATFNCYYRWDGSSTEEIRIEKDTNSLKFVIPEERDVYHLFVRDNIGNYPDGYALIEIEWTNAGATGINNSKNQYLAPNINLILMTDNQPSGSEPDVYVDGNTVTSVIEIIQASDNIIKLRVNDIDQFFAFGLSISL